jgi:hypothetical protein
MSEREQRLRRRTGVEKTVPKEMKMEKEVRKEMKMEKKVPKENVICVGFWNMLADALSMGEFMSNGGDLVSCTWNKRGPKVAQVLRDMFTSGANIVGVVENDHYHWLLHELQKKNEDIKGIRFQKTEPMQSTAYKKGNPSTRTTWEEECVDKETLEMHKNDKVKVYKADDEMTLYYNSKVFSAVKNDDERNPSFYGQQLFTRIGTEETFTVFIAHLPSGDVEKDHLKRKAELEILLTAASAEEVKKNGIIMMDSNYGRHYKNFQELDTMISKSGYENQIDENGNECFKMRHANGAQEDKFGELMFDTIDKICTPHSETTVCTPMKLVSTFFQEEHRLNAKENDEVMKVRTNKDLRKKLKKVCIEEHWYDDSSGKNAPSTKWTKKGDMWIVPSASAQEVKCDEFQNNVHACKAIQTKLFPNEHCPSDHPPVLLRIEKKITQSESLY